MQQEFIYSKEVIKSDYFIGENLKVHFFFDDKNYTCKMYFYSLLVADQNPYCVQNYGLNRFNRTDAPNADWCSIVLEFINKNLHDNIKKMYNGNKKFTYDTTLWCISDFDRRMRILNNIK